MTTPNAFTWPAGKRAAVSLSFDDARLSQPHRGFELLDGLAAPTTFYVSIGLMNQRLERWKDLVTRGLHEIGNHTLTHPCSGNYPWSRNNALEDYTLARMEREMLDANEQIAQLLGVTPTTFAYPCGQKFVGRGAAAASYVPLVAKHFKVGRGYNDTCANDPAFCDPAQALGIDLDMQPFEASRRKVDSAIQQGGWLIFVGHEIGDGGHQTVILSELERLIRYCQDPARGVWLDTVDRIGSHVVTSR